VRVRAANADGRRVEEKGRWDLITTRALARKAEDEAAKIRARNGQTATNPLPDDLANDLAARLAPLPSGTPVFRLLWGEGAKMLHPDWQAAGIPYEDASGLFFDFHALRCQTATLADAAGVSASVEERRRPEPNRGIKVLQTSGQSDVNPSGDEASHSISERFSLPVPYRSTIPPDLTFLEYRLASTERDDEPLVYGRLWDFIESPVPSKTEMSYVSLGCSLH